MRSSVSTSAVVKVADGVAVAEVADVVELRGEVVVVRAVAYIV